MDAQVPAAWVKTAVPGLAKLPSAFVEHFEELVEAAGTEVRAVPTEQGNLRPLQLLVSSTVSPMRKRRPPNTMRLPLTLPLSTRESRACRDPKLVGQRSDRHRTAPSFTKC